MAYMSVTELTSQSPMGSLKAVAPYSAARVGRPCGVSDDLGKTGWGTDDDDDMATQEQQQHADGGTRTANMTAMFVTELTSQSPMGWLKVSAAYSAARDGRPCLSLIHISEPTRRS